MLVAGFVLTLGMAACEGERADRSGYERDVMQERVQRDMDMREEESVIPPSRRSAFRGLDYYAIDTTYRYVVPLQRRATPDTVQIPESTGALTRQVRVGNVTVPLPEGAVELEVFKSMGDTPRGQLWVPFADITNGDSTYKAGRYVNLRRTERSDSVVVDFNRAYNPTCTYNPEFACPLPPEGNRLDQPVPAGEKKPEFGERV